MISNTTRSYYKNGISMSGSAFMPGSIITKKQSEHNNRKLAELTSCPYGRGRSHDFANCLRAIHANLLVLQMTSLFDWGFLPLIPIGPMIEPWSPTAFLTVDPDSAYRAGWVNNASWICTRTKDEGKLISTGLLAFGQNFVNTKFFLNQASIFLAYKYATNDSKATTRKICKYYLDNCTRSSVNVIGVANAITDRQFGYGIHKSMQAHSELAPTYAGFYTYKGRNSLSGRLGLSMKKFEVSHNDDLDTLFNRSHEVPGFSTTDPVYAVVKLHTSLFANFANSGKPLYTDEAGQHVEIWQPVLNSSDMKLLQIGQQVEMISEPTKERLAFWETIGLDDVIPWIPFK